MTVSGAAGLSLGRLLWCCFTTQWTSWALLRPYIPISLHLRTATRRRSVNGAGTGQQGGHGGAEPCILFSLYTEGCCDEIMFDATWNHGRAAFVFICSCAETLPVRCAKLRLSEGEAAKFLGRAPNQGGYFRGMKVWGYRTTKILTPKMV